MSMISQDSAVESPTQHLGDLLTASSITDLRIPGCHGHLTTSEHRKKTHQLYRIITD